MTVPESITPDVTTGHVGDHLELHEWFNNYSTIIVGPDGTGADIATALADAHAAGAGNVKVMGTSYSIGGAAGTAALEISLPTVSLDLGGATINYTGDGICLRVRMDPYTIDNAGSVRNGTIDGAGAGAGAIGIQTGSVIGFGWYGVDVNNFDKAGSVNWDQYNEAASTWMERCRFSNCDSRNGTVEWQWRSHADSSSFLYNDYSDCRFDTGAGQTAFKTIAPAQVFDASLFGFRGNVNNGGTVFNLAGTSIIRPHMAFTVEQTNGLTGVLFAPGSAQILYPKGSFTVINFPDFDTGRTYVDYEGRGGDVRLDAHIVDTIETPYQALGLSVGTDHLGAFAAVYDGGDGAGFSLLKVGFEETLSEARVAARLDSVTIAETGFRPGNFSVGSHPAANSVEAGTMIYIVDIAGGTPVWSDGTDWRDAMGTVVL